MTTPEPRPVDATDSERLMDAASDLLVNDGFDAVTFRHVATRAQVSEDEARRQFDSIEHLLVAMLNREYAGMFRVILENIDRDPLGGLMSRIYRYVFTAVYERPLARTLYLMNRDSLHRILSATNGLVYIPSLEIRADFIDGMKSVGVVRDDVDSEAISAVLSSVAAGTAVTAPHVALDDVIEGLTLMLARGVDADIADSSAGKAVFVDFAMSLINVSDREQSASDELGSS
ncbi:hypothetical protein BH11ACT3_BH11ACT3_01830 [soil metagenome]